MYANTEVQERCMHACTCTCVSTDESTNNLALDLEVGAWRYMMQLPIDELQCPCFNFSYTHFRGTSSLLYPSMVEYQMHAHKATQFQCMQYTELLQSSLHSSLNGQQESMFWSTTSKLLSSTYFKIKGNYSLKALNFNHLIQKCTGESTVLGTIYGTQKIFVHS